MRKPKRRLALIGLILGATVLTPVGPLTSASAIIGDGAHAGAADGFFWLTPTVKKSQKVFSGTFDPNFLTLTPTIDICEINGGDPASPAVCTILKTIDGLTQPEIIRLDAEAENYSATWLETNDESFLPEMTYRAFVSVGPRVLGFVDLQAVAKRKDLKDVDTDEFSGFVVGVPFVFKFRVETGMPGTVVVTPATAMVFDFTTIPTPTQDFQAKVTDFYGVDLPGETVTWTSSSGLATVLSPTGPTDGLGETTTTATVAGTVLSATDVTITADAQGALGTATLTIKPSARPPSAVDDGYTTDAGVNLTVPDGIGDLLDNDDLGIPDAATMDDFGGGDVVGTHLPGSSVALAGGTLTVNANGSLTLVSPSVPGSYTFDYGITNSQGSSTATVGIDVEAAPGAVDEMYMTTAGTTLTVPDGAGDLLDNDDLGFPAAAMTSFGGGSLGGAVTDNAPGVSVAFAGGTLTVNADGSLT